MPLVKGKAARGKQGFSKNVAAEIRAGKPKNQALAIAYSVARESKSKPKENNVAISKHHTHMKKAHEAMKKVEHHHKMAHEAMKHHEEKR